MEIEPAGRLHAALDSAIVFATEGAKTVVQASALTAAQALNGVSALILHYVFEPGYATARRARIAADAVAGSSDEGSMSAAGRGGLLSRVWEQVRGNPPGLTDTRVGAHTHADGDAGGQDGVPTRRGASEAASGTARIQRVPARISAADALTPTLVHAHETIAHQQQPTSANRWSPGLLTEAQLAIMLLIDAAAHGSRSALARMCGGRVRQRRLSAPDTAKAASGTATGACCRRPQRQRAQQAAASFAQRVRDALFAALPSDLVRAPPILLSGKSPSSAGSGSKPSPSALALSSTLTAPLGRDVAVPLASLTEDAASDSESVGPAPPPSRAYWPMPALKNASAACRIIDNVCGFPVQTYAVRTVDGYILTLIRIPRVESSKVVLFQHGLLDSASAWVSTGNVYSLAARAYQSGFDVFLGNLRGSNDALGINGFGSNPVDYAEAMEAEDSAASDGLQAVIARMRSGTGEIPLAIVDPEPSATETGGFPSPLRGARARVNSIELDDDFSIGEAAARSGSGSPSRPADGAASAHPPRHPVSEAARSAQAGQHRHAHVRVVGTSQDGVPVHETLHPRQREYWNFHSQDHALDVMAFLRQIRIIKALEGRQRRKAQASHARGTQGQASARKAKAEKRATSVDSGSESHHDTGTPRSASTAGSHSDMTVDAMSPDADDVRIVAVGHSMGGCVLLMYLLVARALRRPTFVNRAVLLSPAGLHNEVGALPRTLLLAMYYLGMLEAPAPFPARSSTLQRFAARFMQDIKNSSATGDLVAVLGSYFFGGLRHRFVFRYVAISEYPVGGSCTKVIRHGIQAMQAKDFCTYGYDQEENEDRYGSPSAPSFRIDYGILNTPVDFIAGELDTLVPPANIEEQYALLAAVRPGLTTLKTFAGAGHLDFSLTLSDDIISYVLRHLEQGVAGPPPETSTATTSSERPDVSPLLKKYRLEDLAAEARTRAAAVGATLDAGWKPARACAKEFPWLAGFSKHDLVMDGLDAEARDMGLATEWHVEEHDG